MPVVGRLSFSFESTYFVWLVVAARSYCWQSSFVGVGQILLYTWALYMPRPR
jgi:hypothetical protein